jgi:RNA-directed DNA polymerase
MSFSQIVSWDNLLLAYQNAARGKRGRLSAAHFEHQLADRLLQLQADLTDGSYSPGAYTHFYIHEPKRRKISAAPFRDRVVHHALCQQIEPIFEARFHPHSYANRVGKGTHRAVEQLQKYAQRYRYVLRLDIRQHFPSLDHAILIEMLFKYIPDNQTQKLISSIIKSGEGVLADVYLMHYFTGDDLLSMTRPRGLPIGNLTSQFWSNCYLNNFDWFVTRTLGCKGYIRYVDDFAIFSNSSKLLAEWRTEIIGNLAKLRLAVHQQQTAITHCKDGIPWLGLVVYPSHKRLKRRNVVHFRKRLALNLDKYTNGEISFGELDASVQGWINHVRYANTWGLRKSIFRENLIQSPCQTDIEAL